jgi:1-acyl-sn-glycerol-3-phosphate acyltransferase
VPHISRVLCAICGNTKRFGRIKPVPAGLTQSPANILRVIAFALATALFGALALAVSLFDSTGRRQHRIARAWATTLLTVSGCKITVLGADRLPMQPSRHHPGTHRPGPAVYACNHLSYMDTPALFASLRFQFRILAKSQLFKAPFLGWYLRRSGQVAVDSTDTHAGLRSLNVGVKTLRAGLPLVIFPEGSRSPTGKTRDFLSGLAYMAVRAGVPIVPMALIGTYEALPIHVYHITPRPLVLVIGQPIPTDTYSLRQLDELTTQVRAAIEEMYAAHAAPTI